jgi:dTDP-4-amino-4,6-dideoxygalactose transaminase
LVPAAAPLNWRSICSGLIGWSRGQIEVDRFTDELKTNFKVNHCYLFSSGKAALAATLQSLKKMHPDRDQVLIPAYTCYSVPSAIVRAGLNVVLCDVDPLTLDYDFDQLEGKLVDKRLLCVLSNHLFGKSADIRRLRGMILDPQVTIIEDAAQALGGKWRGETLGCSGDVGIYSLGRGKAFSTVEGGVLITNRDDIAEQLDCLYAGLASYTFGEKILLLLYAVVLKCLSVPWLFWLPKGLPFLRMGETIYDPDFRYKRLSSVQAGFSRQWLQQLASLWRDRKTVSLHWTDKLISVGEQTYFPQDCPDLIRYPWRVLDDERRAELLDRSEREGLGVTATYPGSVASIPELKKRFAEKYPGAELCARQLITLPVHPFLGLADIARIDAMISTYKDNTGC